MTKPPFLMRRSFLASTFASVAAALALHCSSEDARSPSSNDDAGGDAASKADSKTSDVDAKPTNDSGPSPLTESQEQEPNNGASIDAGADVAPTLQIGKLALPGAMLGAIDPADDIDIFSVDPKPGELIEWRIVPGSAMAPSLTVFDTVKGNLNPTISVKGTNAGDEIVVDQFVLSSGSFVAGVRDVRNLAATNAHVGGPTFTYRLEGRKKLPTPKVVTFPTKVAGKLSRIGEIAFFQFTGTKGTGFDVIVKAARLGAGSKLDSRLSLFNLTGNQNLLTNDDAAATTDSEIGGTLPSNADYLVVLENEAQGEQLQGGAVPDLSYEIEFKLR